MNLGGWLSQCVHTEEHYASFIHEEDIEEIKKWGMDHIRVPVDYDLVEDRDGAPREHGFEHIRDVIGWCRKYGLNMILDLHKTAGFSFDVGEKEAGLFENEAYQERFYRLWEKFAEYFGKEKDMLAFELLNEVTDKAYNDTWQKMAGECIRRIRKIVPDVYILVGGYYNNSVEAVKDLLMPTDDHIIYNFHCYEPVVFTHQGAHWVAKMDTSFRIPISATFGEMREAWKKMGIFASAGLSDFPDDATLGSDYFEKMFAEAIRVAEERDVPLYCGEYGVIDRAAPEDILAWYRLINAVFEAHGIGRAAWSFRKMDFGLSDARMDGVRAELIRYL